MNPLVTPTWLAGHLSDPDTVILDATLSPVGVTPPVDTRACYVAKHIPGAVFFDIEEFSDRRTQLPHMLLPPDVFASRISALGVSDQMNIVIYEQGSVFSAPRAWWMLRTLGAQNVYVLDGGLHAWIESGLPTHSGEVHRNAANFRAELNGNCVKNFSDIQWMIAQHAQILDARSAGRFTGQLPEPRPGISSGHMPGAISLPYTELTEGNRLKSVKKLRELIAAKGVDLEKPVTTTCGSGVTAAVIALALETVGAQSVSLYDGSWADYATHAEAVIEKS